jgi:hypothetical protein
MQGQCVLARRSMGKKHKDGKDGKKAKKIKVHEAV